MAHHGWNTSYPMRHLVLDTSVQHIFIGLGALILVFLRRAVYLRGDAMGEELRRECSD